ncbi:MAG: hypothetical protein U0270_21050 [Labilithrix sp.]
MDPQPSCYIVELSVDPGGARRGDVYVYSRVEHVRRIVEQEFQSSDPDLTSLAHSLLRYGERTLVWPVNRGVLGEPVDLQKFVAWKDDHFDIDWFGLEAKIPKLEGSLLRSGQGIVLDDPEERTDPLGSYLSLALGEPLDYGYSDLEGGEAPRPDWVDPDPR